MRILALQTQGVVLPAVHLSMVRAFRLQGIDVLETTVPEFFLAFGAFKKMAPGLQCVFTLDMGVDPAFIRRLEDYQHSLRIPWIIWFVDDPEGFGFPDGCSPEWTIPFCWDETIVRQWSCRPARQGVPMEHLPLGADPEIFFPETSAIFLGGGVFVGSLTHANHFFEEAARADPKVEEESGKIWESYSRDFRMPIPEMVWENLSRRFALPASILQQDPLGRLAAKTLIHRLGVRKRREVVRRVMNPTGAVFGDSAWREVLGSRVYRGGVSYGSGLRRVYNESAFVLDTRQLQARTGLTQRIFDAGACGRPVLAEWSPELGKFFDPGNDLFSYSSLEGAGEVKGRCLAEPNLAKKRGERLRKEILAHHTYGLRARRILEAVKRVFG